MAQKTITRTLSKDAVNREELLEVILGVDPSAIVNSRIEAGSTDITVEVTFEESLQAALVAAVTAYIKSEEEEEREDRKRFEEFKTKLIYTFQNLNAQERQQFKNFINSLP